VNFVEIEFPGALALCSIHTVNVNIQNSSAIRFTMLDHCEQTTVWPHNYVLIVSVHCTLLALLLFWRSVEWVLAPQCIDHCVLLTPPRIRLSRSSSCKYIIVMFRKHPMIRLFVLGLNMTQVSHFVDLQAVLLLRSPTHTLNNLLMISVVIIILLLLFEFLIILPLCEPFALWWLATVIRLCWCYLDQVPVCIHSAAEHW